MSNSPKPRRSTKQRSASGGVVTSGATRRTEGDVNGSNGAQRNDNSDNDEDERPLKRKRQPTCRSRSQRRITN
ncbi:hypothetical protein BJV82DRAFT_96395 [Fennellomyces sp. T-0311]|nr:hypothetical protein BJV82DRAFT_96395 [Fennellomyces sp. T-0311]